MSVAGQTLALCLSFYDCFLPSGQTSDLQNNDLREGSSKFQTPEAGFVTLLGLFWIKYT